MQPSIPWSSIVPVFVIERVEIIPSLKCTVPFSFVVPLLLFPVTHCHLLSLVVSLVVILCHLLQHSLSVVATRCTTRCHLLYHSLSFVVTCCTTRCHSLSLDVPLVCLFINDLSIAYTTGVSKRHTHCIA